MELEDYYKRNLEIYLREVRKDYAGGISRMQRICRIGYNQAVKTIEYGIEKGLLEKDSEKEWLHIIPKQIQGSKRI